MDRWTVSKSTSRSPPQNRSHLLPAPPPLQLRSQNLRLRRRSRSKEQLTVLTSRRDRLASGPVSPSKITRLASCCVFHKL